MDGVEQMIDVPVKNVITEDLGQSCILAWFLAAIPTLEGTPNTIANSVAATSMAATGGRHDFHCGVRSAGTFIGIQVDQVRARNCD